VLITSAQRLCTDGLTSESKTATERNFDSFGSLSATSRCFRGTQAVERLQLSALTRYCASSPNQSYSGTLALPLPRDRIDDAAPTTRRQLACWGRFMLDRLGD
jgi:hypothetical protein